MSDTLLFIVEGERVEPRILESLWHSFFRNTSKSKYFVTYDSNIYLLWNEMKADTDLELLEILIERNDRNREELRLIKNEISEVYLFFDYDGHANEASDDDLIEMVEYFNIETDNGKLFISYPMAEALRHINPSSFNFQDLTVPAKENIHYKEKVGRESTIQNVSKINGNLWNMICSENLRKGNNLINRISDLPSDPSSVEQFLILKNQLNEYITPQSLVSVLSAFPFFIYHYIGNGILNRFRQ